MILEEFFKNFQTLGGPVGAVLARGALTPIFGVFGFGVLGFGVFGFLKAEGDVGLSLAEE